MRSFKKVHSLGIKLKKGTFTTQNFSNLILKGMGGHWISKLCYYDFWMNFNTFERKIDNPRQGTPIL